MGQDDTINTSVRLPRWLYGAIDDLADEYDTNKTQIILTYLKNGLANEDEDFLPEHREKDLIHHEIKEKNKWKRRRLWYKSNVKSEIREVLNSSHPPDPFQLWHDLIEARREEARQEFPRKSHEFYEFLKDQYRFYESGWYDRMATREETQDTIDLEDSFYRKIADEIGKENPNHKRVSRLYHEAKQQGIIRQDLSMSDVIRMSVETNAN